MLRIRMKRIRSSFASVAMLLATLTGPVGGGAVQAGPAMRVIVAATLTGAAGIATPVHAYDGTEHEVIIVDGTSWGYSFRLFFCGYGTFCDGRPWW